eukprot:gene12545-13831_t
MANKKTGITKTKFATHSDTRFLQKEHVVECKGVGGEDNSAKRRSVMVGPKEFSAFGNDEMIMKKFFDVVTDGMKRKAVQMSKNTQDELGQQTETRVKGIDESLVKILLEEDVRFILLDFVADCINLNQGRESKERLCMWGKQCSAGESCCVCLAGGYNLVKNVDSPGTKCCDCEKHFHEICVKEALGSELSGWSCGCKTSFEELKNSDKFKNIDDINYMFRRWSREIKKFVTQIWSERIGSKRKRIVDFDKACYLSSDMMNFFWLLEDESVVSFKSLRWSGSIGKRKTPCLFFAVCFKVWVGKEKQNVQILSGSRGIRFCFAQDEDDDFE